jgi:diguanylate cyclase (GGDEF)-like protein
MKSTDTAVRILVADDDPTVSLLMRAILEVQGYDATVVDDGALALAKFQAHPADLVLLDVEMPGLTGYEVCRAIRQLDHHVPVVLITGNEDVPSIERAFEVGATDFIAKPINWTLIGHRLRYILRAFRDGAQRRAAELKVWRLAYYDTLTGLPNRQAFEENLSCEISRQNRSAPHNQRMAILFLDINNFKSINDSFGRSVGDRLLQSISERLRSGMRRLDMLGRQTQHAGGEARYMPLARMGGDGFTILLPHINTPEAALVIANRIRKLLGRPFVVDSQELVITASIGIAVYPDDATEASALIMDAETAMYAAKESGRDTCHYYSASLTERAIARLSTGTALRLALQRNEFFLLYQPQVDADSGHIRSVEALIRWRHPVKGLISPVDFIPLTEELGLIMPIGTWVLRTACQDAMRWRAMGLPPLQIAVNLSAVQFRNPRLLDEILSTLAETGVGVEQLELEITESTLMEDAASALNLMHALRSHGIHIALDDFGTGYSSLQYLKQLPLSKLKIDRAFVRDLPESKADEAIIRAVVVMAKALGMRVLAEGVETQAQSQALTRMGCDSLQGYLYSKPVSFDAIATLLQQQTQKVTL